MGWIATDLQVFMVADGLPSGEAENLYDLPSTERQSFWFVFEAVIIMSCVRSTRISAYHLRCKLRGIRAYFPVLTLNKHCMISTDTT